MLAPLLLLFAQQGDLPALMEKGAIVLLFVRSDCPVSNRYAPELERLYRRYAPRGVDFRLVYPENGLTRAAMESHASEYGYTIPAVRDTAHELVSRARARVTPEAAVFVHGRLVYLGRIDDRYLDTGKARIDATHHDLEEVLAAIAAGKVLRLHETKAVGCAIEHPR